MSAAEPRRSPYQGLTPFDERDASYFFGREKDSRLISADLYAAPISVLYGASGVGKSSVLRAGVVPLLRPSDDLLVVVFNTWQNEPATELKGAVARALFASLEGDAEASQNAHDEVLRNEYDPLAKFLPMCAKLARRRLMIILDQFEEFFLYHPDGGPFSDQFPPATSLGDLSVSFLISLREDALAGLDHFEGKIAGLFDNLRRIDHLDGAAARDAIRKPLERYAQDHPDEPRITADDDLVEAVVEDVRANRIAFEGTGRGAEIATRAGTADRVEAPYLQLVMTRLWDDARNREATSLELGTFISLGKAKKIVDDHLGAVLGRLTEEERDAAARVFEFLVTPSGTKIAHTVRDLSISAGVDGMLLNTMMERLSTGIDRVLRPVAALAERPDEPRYEIFHDRLAPAILAWRTEYVQKKKLAEVNLSEIERKRGSNFVLRPSAAKSRTATGEPPYGVFADLLRDGRLTVIFGSGASASARPGSAVWQPRGPYTPTASELTQYLAHIVDFPGEAASLAEVASYFAAVASPDGLHHELHELLRTPSQPAPIHRAIARAAKDTPLLILTSTFDALVERALDDASVRYGVVAHDLSKGTPLLQWTQPSGDLTRGPAKAFRYTLGQTWVYKLFGSVHPTRPDWSTFVITEEDEMLLFSSFNNGSLLPAPFAEKLSTHHALFLGMGLRSWTQRLLLSSLQPVGRRSKSRRWAIGRDVPLVDSRRWQQAEVEIFDRDLNQVAAHLDAALERTGR